MLRLSVINHFSDTILIDIHNIRFYGEIIPFYQFSTNPRFELGVTFVQRCFSDEIGMLPLV